MEIHLKTGVKTKLVFATVNEKPAALVVEDLKIQRWLSKNAEAGEEAVDKTERMASSTDVTRELVSDRIVELTIKPSEGSYSFYDALTGAQGKILVE